MQAGAAALALFGLLGCTTAGRPLLRGVSTVAEKPASHSRVVDDSACRENPWYELVSSHFVLRTDRDVEQGAAALRMLENAHAALERLEFAPATAPCGPIQVILFRRAKDLHYLVPTLASGRFLAPSPRGTGLAPTILATSETSQPEAVLLHELVHALVQRTYGVVPSWLDEGLAQYYQTLRFDNGFVHYGGGIPETSGSALLDVKDLLSPARTTALSREHQGNREIRAAISRYYLTAWVLVHMLHRGRAVYTQQFAALRERMIRHPTNQDAIAWDEIFDGLSANRVQDDLLEHLRRADRAPPMRYEVPRLPAPQVRKMSAEEITGLWASLSPRRRTREAQAPRPNDAPLLGTAGNRGTAPQG